MTVLPGMFTVTFVGVTVSLIGTTVSGMADSFSSLRSVSNAGLHPRTTNLSPRGRKVGRGIADRIQARRVAACLGGAAETGQRMEPIVARTRLIGAGDHAVEDRDGLRPAMSGAGRTTFRGIDV